MDREDRYRLPAARRRFGGERGSGRSAAKDDERRNRRLRSLPGRSGRYRQRPFRPVAPGMSTQPGSGRHRPRPAHRATRQRGIGRGAGATCRRQRAGGTLMRIRKLGLRRYGKFTDEVIDFGERSAGAPDLHIVYGPNEAGKSTAMSACMDLFYGIHHQSRFNFLHPYPTMRIDAELEIFGTVRSFSRIKLPHNSLLDDAGNTVADAMLLGELGGLDRNAYQTMFCLDDETLEAGGESILASKGDLGHLLFSATAGLADLSDRLGSAKAEAESFFRSGKRSGALADLKKELANLKDERDRTDTLASEYSRLVIERDEATSAYTEALAQRGRTQARIDEVQRFINALPRLQTFRSLRAELLPLATLPDAPSTWADDLPALMTRQTKLATQTQTVAETIADLRDGPAGAARYGEEGPTRPSSASGARRTDGRAGACPHRSCLGAGSRTTCPAG